MIGNNKQVYLKLRSKGLIIITISLFLIVNLNYYWEGKLGILAFPTFIFLATVFLILAIICIVQMIKGIKEKFSNKDRNRTMVIMAISLGLIFLKPSGLINFDKLEGEDLLIAQREGTANCMVTFKLKANNKFRERSVCFGVSEARGIYEIKNDTVFFSEVSLPIGEEKFYAFAILRKSKNKHKETVVLYRNRKDTSGVELFVRKNEILK
jgi:hypothetical protein